MKIFLLGFSNESKRSEYLSLKATTCLTCFLHVYIHLLRKQQGCCNGNSDIDWWCFVFCFLFSVLIGCCRSHGQMPTSHCFAWQWASVAVSMTHCNYRRKAFPCSDFSVHSYHCSHSIWGTGGSMLYLRTQGWRRPHWHSAWQLLGRPFHNQLSSFLQGRAFCWFCSFPSAPYLSITMLFQNLPALVVRTVF